MRTEETLRRGAAVLALALGGAASAGATTMVRASLEDLTAAHETIVVGEVLDARSYWNRERNFILTDVRIAPSDVLKGSEFGEIAVTLMGGSVGDRTALVVAGAELRPGRSYLLFLGRGPLPGAPGALTVRYLSQGAFDVAEGADGVARAVSQAAGHPLVADRLGRTEVPGGSKGLPLDELTQAIRNAVEVQR